MTSGGGLQTRQTYYPYGAKRVFDGSALSTDYTFTGQKSDDTTGLMFYNARYYDTTLGRFTQADTIVPNPMNPQSFNRYSYTYNNPVRYTDPTGHTVPCDVEPTCGKIPATGNPGAKPPAVGGAAGTDGSNDDIDPPTNTGGNQNTNDGGGGGSGGCQPRCKEKDDIVDSEDLNPCSVPMVCDAEYSLWREHASGCWGCHITHYYGRVPTNDELGGESYFRRPLWGYLAGARAVSSLLVMQSALYANASAVKPNPNAIGSWGARKVGEQLPIEVRQFRMPGGQRIYDGRFLGTTDQFVEIKTTTTRVVNMKPEIRAQITYDAQMNPKPMWIFVNGNPSSGVRGALNNAGIPWHELHVR